jgi:hypothetical protein
LKTRDEFAKLSKVERCLNIVAVQATLALKKNISAIVGQQWPQYIVSGAFGRKNRRVCSSPKKIPKCVLKIRAV